MKIIKELLKKNQWIRLLANYKRIIMEQYYLKKYDDYSQIKTVYESKLKRKLNLKSPKRFTDKLQWLKIFYRNSLMPICADKASVRDWVTDCGYEELLVPIVGIYDNPDLIPWERIPTNCIFKATKGSSMYILKKKDYRKMPFIWKLIMKSWEKMNIYIEGREWPYNSGSNQIICEHFIKPKKGIMKDYKFFCFNGEPKYIQVDSDLLNNHKVDFFDIEWNKLELKGQYENSNETINEPFNYEKMIEVSRDLSKYFPHVRIDFYEYDEILKIGELTFFDGSGLYNFHPDKWDFIWGEKLHLPKVNYNLEIFNRVLRSNNNE